MPYEPGLVFRCLADNDYRKYWDANVDYDQFIEKVTENVYIKHNSVAGRGIWPLKFTRRDFVFVTKFEKHPTTGMITAVSHSLASVQGKAPTLTKQCIRGSLYFGGWSLEKVGNHTRMTLMAEVDLKGSIPKSLLSWGNSQAGQSISKLRDIAIPQYIKDH